MIISVHLPKTAGVSFSNALENVFSGKLLKDYGDFPINTDPYERKLAALQNSMDNPQKDFNDIACIHGHFLPLKYLLLAEKRELTFITWMRHPLQRLVSHYHYWQRSYTPETAQSLHKRVVEEQWSLERFCLSSELANLYSQFLWGFPLYMFSFIGITEYYQEDLDYFANNFLGQKLGYYEANTGKDPGDQYIIEDKLYEEMEAHHQLDMELYRRALAMRVDRLDPRSGRVKPVTL